MFDHFHLLLTFLSNKYICPGDVQTVGLPPTFLAPPGLIWLLQCQDFVVEKYGKYDF